MYDVFIFNPLANVLFSNMAEDIFTKLGASLRVIMLMCIMNVDTNPGIFYVDVYFS